MTTNKPKDNHPWKNCASSKAIAWAKDEARIRNVNNVVVARNETLSRRNINIHDRGGLK